MNPTSGGSSARDPAQLPAALKIVGQRDKSRHASGRDGWRPPRCARGFTPGGTGPHTQHIRVHTCGEWARVRPVESKPV